MTQSPDIQRTEQILLPAAQEVLGADGLRSLQAGTSSADQPVSSFLQSLEHKYGAQPGRGLALRIGRASFRYALRQYGPALGLTGTAFRLLPLPSKFTALGGALGELLNTDGRERVRLEQRDGLLLVHLVDCPLCRGRQAAEPVCQLAVGLAQEALYWLSGGKTFQVEETQCSARGDADCTVQINKTPLS